MVVFGLCTGLEHSTTRYANIGRSVWLGYSIGLVDMVVLFIELNIAVCSVQYLVDTKS